MQKYKYIQVFIYLMFIKSIKRINKVLKCLVYLQKD